MGATRLLLGNQDISVIRHKLHLRPAAIDGAVHKRRVDFVVFLKNTTVTPETNLIVRPMIAICGFLNKSGHRDLVDPERLLNPFLKVGNFWKAQVGQFS